MSSQDLAREDAKADITKDIARRVATAIDPPISHVVLCAPIACPKRNVTEFSFQASTFKIWTDERFVYIEYENQRACVPLTNVKEIRRVKTTKP